MWCPTLLFDRRAYGPEKLSSVTQKDFCNTICQNRTSLQRQIAPIGLGLTRLLLVQGSGPSASQDLFLGRRLMVELVQFLKNLELSHYLEKFAHNDIDGAALLELEETHLKE